MSHKRIQTTSPYKKGISLWNNKLAWSVVLYCMATILSAAKIIELPQGGAATCFSLLMLWLITFFYGFKHGLLMSVLFGFAKFAITYLSGESFIEGVLPDHFHWVFLLEYPLACGCFCLGGLIKTPDSEDEVEEPFKLVLGYLIGVFGMLFCYVLAAVTCYQSYRTGFVPNLIYSIQYDGIYLAFEAFLTLLLLGIPPVRNAIYYLKYVATHDLKDYTLDSF